MPLEFVKSQQSSNHVVHLGHRYIYQTSGKTCNTWVCVLKRNYKCGGAVFTANNEVIRVKEHNHTPDGAKIEVKKIQANIRTAAQTTSDHPKVIVAACTQGISASASVQLATVRSIKRTIRNIRVKSQDSHPLPSSLLTMEIPEIYRLTVKREMFLLYDSGKSDDRILIFGTTKNLEHMQNSSEWFADGTFKVAPKFFDQLYTIHICRFNRIFPALYILLPNRSESTCVKMLSALRDLAPALNPRSITTDFEKAAKNAFKKVFPEAVQNGCLCHLGQCFWRKIQQLPEVSKNYIHNPDYALKVKFLTALAFVPSSAVKEAFDALISDDFYANSSHMEGMVDYVEENWIGGIRTGKLRPARFAIEEWNCFDRVMNGQARTNNAVEGWHRGFQTQLGAHPTMWKFIETIQKEQSYNEVEVEKHLAGENPQPKPKKVKDATDRIKSIAEDYENRPIMDYLIGIAHNLSLNV